MYKYISSNPTKHTHTHKKKKKTQLHKLKNNFPTSLQLTPLPETAPFTMGEASLPKGSSSIARFLEACDSYRIATGSQGARWEFFQKDRSWFISEHNSQEIVKK